MTVKEAKKEIKAKYDEFLMGLYKEYGKKIVDSYTIQDLLRHEAGMAQFEMDEYGRIWTDGERWKH